MRVTVIAHASVLIEMGAERLLVDPVFDEVFASGTLCFQPPRAIDADGLSAAATALAITHIHLDHFHPPTLARLPKHLPVIVPPHGALVEAVRALGFARVVTLAPWQRHALGTGFVLATPSEFEVAEFGLAAVHAGASYWHMSDAIVTAEAGRRLRAEIGAVAAAAVKYQPLRTLIGYQRGLQALVLDRDELVASFEAACAAGPAFLFPYFSGFAFHGEHAWANRHVNPYGAEEIARLLRRRLAGAATVDTVAPGDVLDIAGREVCRHAGASALARPAEGRPVQPWEPIDPASLAGLADPGERGWLAEALRALLAGQVLPWLADHLAQRSGLFDAYRELQAVWQLVVHLGDGERLHHAVDFRPAEAEVHFGARHPDANVFSHLSGRALARVLRGEAGAEVFWMAGGYRVYEKLLLVAGARLLAPPLAGWELFERLPDPVCHYLRKVPHPARPRH